jgi:hypothetical protein
VRVFDSTFASLIGDADFAETFMVCEIVLPSRTVYLADRADDDGEPYQIGGNDYLPLVFPGGFGEIASVLERGEAQLDLKEVELRVSNHPELPGGVSLSAVLGQFPERSLVYFWWCVLDNVGGIHRELAWVGCTQWYPGYGYEEIKIRVLSLPEAFLSLPWGRTLSAVDYDFFFMAPEDDGATLRIPVGDARNVPGIVLRGPAVSTMQPFATNSGDGAYVGAVELGQGVQALASSPTGFAVVLTFSSATAFSVTVGGQAVGSGNINDDFEPQTTSPFPRLFKLPGGQWIGTPQAGDQFFFQGRAVFPSPPAGDRSIVVWAEDLQGFGYPMGGVSRFYWNLKPVVLNGGSMSGSWPDANVNGGGELQLTPKLTQPVVLGSMKFQFNDVGLDKDSGFTISLYRGRLPSEEEKNRLLESVLDALYPRELIEQWAFDLKNVTEASGGLGFIDFPYPSLTHLKGTLIAQEPRYLPADWYFVKYEVFSPD